jgi:hypothetical protein
MLGALVLMLQTAPPRPVAPVTRESPRLAVLVVVDQMRPDYLTRYATQYTGGLRRLLDSGLVYLDGRHDHAMTETAPGHSTLLSGRQPAATGILSNDNGVNDPAYPIVGGGAGDPASPLRFQGTTLYDWMLARDAGVRVFSVARKDRSAILPVGRARRDVYWWTRGRWGTSRYYRDSLPDWLQEYNRRTGWRAFAGGSWRPLLDDSAYVERDSVSWEGNGREIAFPHPIPADTTQLASRIIYYPWMDSLTLDLALEGTRQLQLGQRTEGADLLVVGLSTTDRIGHDFGPDSKEIHDQLLRLDRWLAWFTDSLERLVPTDQIVWAMTSDHGTQRWMERTVDDGGAAARLSLSPLVRGLRTMLQSRWGSSFNFTALRARGVDVDRLADSLAREVRAMTGIRRVYTPRSLRAAPPSDREAALWRRGIPPRQGWLFAASIVPGYGWGHDDHGSTALEDQQVPIAFRGVGIPVGRVTRPVSTTDIGPTLAALLRVRPTEPITGVVLPEVVPRRPARQSGGVQP